MLRWHPATGVDVAAPGAADALLKRAIAQQPHSAALRVGFADLALDRFDFAAAAEALEAALLADPALSATRPRLARCYNFLGRPGEALELFTGHEPPEFERGVALDRLERQDEAESEFRAVLAVDPNHWPACRRLGKILLRSGRIDALLALCDDLWARGARHAQLLYNWGVALALSGQDADARAILFDRDRVARCALPVPEGFADISAFNAALVEEILGNPYQLSEFPIEDEANRGSSRIHALFSGPRPELFHALLESLQSIAEGYVVPRYDSFDPWLDARPDAARLKAWALIQRGNDYEAWHSHPGGWLSGVYYIRVPAAVSIEGDGPGCIEFGAPPAVQRARPGFAETWRHAPCAGQLLLAPSHYAHRTIPSGADEYRISFAFDVVPVRTPPPIGPAVSEGRRQAANPADRDGAPTPS